MFLHLSLLHTHTNAHSDESEANTFFFVSNSLNVDNLALIYSCRLTVLAMQQRSAKIVSRKPFIYALKNFMHLKFYALKCYPLKNRYALKRYPVKNVVHYKFIHKNVMH